MAASGNLSISDSALSRKKEEILARSMAILDQELTQWLDKSFSEPMKRAGKRARDDHDSGVEDGSSTTSPKQEVRNTKKRAKREPKAAPTGRRFACPFYSNNPAKYKAVKTCCGPGWNDVHRVKEHIDRRHFLKYACPRCFEQFNNVEELKQHQRMDDPCKVRKNTKDDVITDEQHTQIHKRAKTNQQQEDRWKEMYLIIFPGAKIPSPYYETTIPKEEEEDKEPTTTASTPNGIKLNEFIQFKNEAEVLECKAHIHRGLRRAVRPVLEKEVEKLLRSVQHAMAQRVTDICKDVVTKIVRTWQFGSQQAASSPSSPSPSRSPSPPSSASYEEEAVQAATVPVSMSGPVEVSFEQFITDTPSMMDSFLMEDGEFDLEAILAAGGLDSAECGESFTATASDSAYFSNSTESGGAVVDREWYQYEV